MKRLIRPRREGALHGGPRLGADGAGSTESLGGPLETELPEGREADGTGGSEGLVTRMSLFHVSHLGICCTVWCALVLPCHLPPPALMLMAALCSRTAESLAWAPPFCLYCHLPISTQPTVTPKTSEQQGTLEKDYLCLMVVQKETEGQGAWGCLAQGSIVNLCEPAAHWPGPWARSLPAYALLFFLPCVTSPTGSLLAWPLPVLG